MPTKTDTKNLKGTPKFFQKFLAAVHAKIFWKIFEASPLTPSLNSGRMATPTGGKEEHARRKGCGEGYPTHYLHFPRRESIIPLFILGETETQSFLENSPIRRESSGGHGNRKAATQPTRDQ